MKLNNLNTAYQKMSVIEYGADGVTIVTNLHDAQHISGPMYKSRPIVRGGEVVCDLYIFYDVEKPGCCLARNWKDFGSCELDDVVACLTNCHMDTVDGCLASLDAAVKAGELLGMDMVSFAAQYDAERSAAYEQARKEWMEKNRMEKKKRVAVRRKSDLAKRLKLQQEEDASRKKNRRWERMVMREPMEKAYMNGIVSVNGRLMTRKEFMIALVSGGWKPVEVPGEKPLYLMKHGDFQYRLSKPCYEYACGLYATLPENRKEVV